MNADQKYLNDIAWIICNKNVASVQELEMAREYLRGEAIGHHYGPTIISELADIQREINKRQPSDTLDWLRCMARLGVKGILVYHAISLRCLTPAGPDEMLEWSGILL